MSTARPADKSTSSDGDRVTVGGKIIKWSGCCYMVQKTPEPILKENGYKQKKTRNEQNIQTRKTDKSHTKLQIALGL